MVMILLFTKCSSYQQEIEMLSEVKRSLPENISLHHLKKQAKDILKKLKRHHVPVHILNAQHYIALSYGFNNWTELERYVEERYNNE